MSAHPRLNIAIQMDHPASLNAGGDSTIVLALEAQRRGFELYAYQPTDLCWKAGELYALNALPIVFYDDTTRWYESGAPQTINLREMDVVLVRQDPPYDMNYLTATYLLEHIMDDVLVANNPISIRNGPEKLSILHFADLIPPTIVTRNVDEIKAFRAQHEAIIVKPLYGYGGRSVFQFTPEDPNLLTVLEHLFASNHEPVMVQRFLPQVASEDKRVILMDGRVCGATGRIPASGEIRANFRVGGTAAAVELSDHQRGICERVGSLIAAHGIIFAGLDLIGDYLTEINLTSPTGLRAIMQLYGTNPAVDFWNAIEARL